MGRLSKDKRDVYYRAAKQEGFRARSAFKLLQLDHTLDLLSGVRNVADLCAAPGGWSQVLALRLHGASGASPAAASAGRSSAAAAAGDASAVVEASAAAASAAAAAATSTSASSSAAAAAPARIVAVDMYEMQPIEGVIQVQGDITHEETARAVLSHFGGEKADLVVCDGAPDVTNISDFDEYVQHQLVLTELRLAAALLRVGGVFVAKVFRGEHIGHVYARLQALFSEVLCCKPRASRNSSVECFVVCRGFAPPAGGFEPGRLPELEHDMGTGAPLCRVPFVACGGEEALDADTNYPVDGDHQVLAPLAPPIQAPYAEALGDRRGQKRPAAAATLAPAADDRSGTAPMDGAGGE
eukprot:TRINITY_DN1422_c1_g2_i2.p1 TRINITY_DN1422_c1_g2~~TRINITY_DN1422_c1_g2_i2.p1  ORF type:complete len:355 (-),score=100.16 TRINITY_DN1422_c1_g2_i2:217-1281(-)